MADDGSGNAAEQPPDEPAAAVGAEHDQACFALLGRSSTIPFQVGAASICDALRPEPGPLCQRGSVGCGLLRRRLHLGRVLGVEVLVVDGYESDVCRLPDAEDECVAAGRELLRRLARSRVGRARSRRRRRGRVRAPRRSGRVDGISVGAFGRELCRGDASTDSCQQRRGVPRWALAREEALEVGGLWVGAAERVESHADEGACDGEPEADPERDLRPDFCAAADVSRRSRRRSGRP